MTLQGDIGFYIAAHNASWAARGATDKGPSAEQRRHTQLATQRQDLPRAPDITPLVAKADPGFA